MQKLAGKMAAEPTRYKQLRNSNTSILSRNSSNSKINHQDALMSILHSANGSEFKQKKQQYLLCQSSTSPSKLKLNSNNSSKENHQKAFNRILRNVQSQHKLHKRQQSSQTNTTAPGTTKKLDISTTEKASQTEYVLSPSPAVSILHSRKPSDEKATDQKVATASTLPKTSHHFPIKNIAKSNLTLGSPKALTENKHFQPNPTAKQENKRDDMPKKRNNFSLYSITPQSRSQEQFTFKPTILKKSLLLSRNNSIENILLKGYEKSKQELYNKIKQEQQQEEELHRNPLKVKSPSSRLKHQEFIESSFNKHFEHVFAELDHNRHTHLLMPNECFLSFTEFLAIMETLKYVRNFQLITDSDSQKLQQLWKFLGGQEYNGVTKSKLRQALAITEGIYIPNINNKQLQRGSFVQNEAYLNKKTKHQTLLQISWQNMDSLQEFRKCFGQFSINRKSNMDTGCSCVDHHSHFNFKPTLQKSSVVLANRYRNKVIGSACSSPNKENKIDINTFFKLKSEEYERKKNEKIRKKMEEQMLHCTFKPTINIARNMSSKTRLGHQRNTSTASGRATPGANLENRQTVPRQPMFSLEIRLREQVVQQIYVYEGQAVEEVMESLKFKYKLSPQQQSAYRNLITANIQEHYAYLRHREVPE